MNPRCLVFCCSRIILRDQSLISWYYQAKNRNYLLLPLFYEHGTKIPRSSKPVSSAISNNSLQNTNKISSPLQHFVYRPVVCQSFAGRFLAGFFISGGKNIPEFSRFSLCNCFIFLQAENSPFCPRNWSLTLSDTG